MNSLPQRRSLVSQTVEVLREKMDAGVWPDSLPGERELSAGLHISRPTLRAALELLRGEGRLDVSHGQRRRVRQMAPRPIDPSRRTRVVLISPLPLHRMPPFVMFWVHELRRYLIDEGFFLEILVRPVANTARPEKHLERMVKENPATVWVLLLSNEPMQRWFETRGLSSVVAGSRFGGVNLPSVDVDSHAVCRHAATLLSRKGREHIALLLPEGRTAGDEASERGFLEGAALNAGVRATILRHQGTPDNVCQKLEQHLGSKSRISGLLVARSVHALTAFTYLQKRGVLMPKELSFISRDNDGFLEHVVPRLTRYACDPLAFARRVSRVVLRLTMEGPISNQRILLMPELVKGETLH
jgi:DNA-binding LacI/PurR family transcriptional regulator